MQKFVLTLDLNNDPELIESYIAHHKQVWPEILQSITDSGITQMEIFNLGDRLFMIIEATDAFSFEKKAVMDEGNTKVQEWETLMEQYQKVLPGESSSAKWKLMNRIFDLKEQVSNS